MLSAGGRVLDTGARVWRGGRRVQIQRRMVNPGSTSSGADKEGIADTRPPSTAQEPAEASSRPLPRAGPKPRPRPRPPSAPAARLHHAYDPRASAQAHGGLGWPWAQARPGLGSAWAPLGPPGGPRGSQNNPKTITKQLPKQQKAYVFVFVVLPPTGVSRRSFLRLSHLF